MRAIEFQEYGGPEVLRVVDAEVPEPGPGRVSVDVAWAGVNFADLKARAEGYRVPALPHRPGLEVSGRVRADDPLRVALPVAHAQRTCERRHEPPVSPTCA